MSFDAGLHHKGDKDRGEIGGVSKFSALSSGAYTTTLLVMVTLSPSVAVSKQDDV
jgi:hypothetical protein